MSIEVLAFRNYAPMLTKIAQRHNEVTYFNISSASWTWPIIEAQGFRAYCKGLFYSFPLVARHEPGATVEIVTPDATAIDGLPAGEIEILVRHAALGCLSFVCRTPKDVLPFVLLPMRVRRGWIALPAMQLIYCPDVADHVACAGTIGRMLLGHGKFAVLLNANGPVAGLTGFYTEKRGRNISRDRTGRVSPISRIQSWCCTGLKPHHTVIASEAKQSRLPPRRPYGLLRRFAPRNDDAGSTPPASRYARNPNRASTPACRSGRLKLPIVDPDHGSDLGEISGREDLVGFLEIQVTQGQFLDRFHSMLAKPPVHGGSAAMVSSLGQPEPPCRSTLLPNDYSP
jgi:hypothetical protein